MARKQKLRKAKNSIAVVVDGEDEKWYLNKVKEHYPCELLKTIKIKPELPVRKKVQELFDLAKSKLEKDYTFVILILDLDEPLKKSGEFTKFKDLYEKYLLAKRNNLVGRQKAIYGWMANILVIVNNPCLEYWYLLHYRKTTKYFADFKALSPEIHRIPELSTYQKCETYYNNHPNIYERLTENGLKNARYNATEFNLENCKYQGGSEMFLMFDFFDNL